jgi:hypothetical protein
MNDAEAQASIQERLDGRCLDPVKAMCRSIQRFKLLDRLCPIEILQ